MRFSVLTIINLVSMVLIFGISVCGFILSIRLVLRRIRAQYIKVKEEKEEEL